MKCRGCGTPLHLSLVDLGTAPPSNAYLSAEQLDQAESWVPLRVLVCEACWLVQTEDYRAADTLFDPTYAYFSSYSSSWLEHAQRYVEAMIERFGLDADSRVIEIAANDGYLLQYVAAAGIPCLGVEPTASTAAAARARGLDIRECFFGASAADELREQGWAADLMVANNVLAHVPDINDFLQGFSRLLKATGVVTFEFPHLLRLMENQHFDTLLKHPDRTVFNQWHVQPGLTPNRDTIYHFDVFPTVLYSLGFRFPDNRLGLGGSGFGPPPALPADHDPQHFLNHVLNYSPKYLEFWHRTEKASSP